MAHPDTSTAAAAAQRLAASHEQIAHTLRGEDDPRRAADGAPRAPAGLVGTLANHLLAPLAQKHPWALVGGAAIAGALLVGRPGRRVVQAGQAALLAGLLSPAAKGWALRTVVSAWARRAGARPDTSAASGPGPGQ